MFSITVLFAQKQILYNLPSRSKLWRSNGERTVFKFTLKNVCDVNSHLEKDCATGKPFSIQFGRKHLHICSTVLAQ